MMAENKEATTGETTQTPEPEAAPPAPSNGAAEASTASTEEASAAPSEAPTELPAQAPAEGEEEAAAPELKTDGAPELPKEGDMSFAEMFELAEKQSAEKRKAQKEAIGGNIRPGQVLFAKVVGFSHDSIFLDIGAKAEGVIAKSELVDENGELNLTEGDKVEARVRKFDGGTVILSKVLPHQSLKNREELKEAHRTNIPVEGRVTGQNKGGYDVEVAGIRAFCPASQIDMRPGKGDNYIGRKFHFRITELKDNGRNIVVSRRAILIEENKKKAEKVLETLEAGQTVQGTVTSLKDYGAFVDIGGLEGLVHLSEITHGHISKPRDVLKVGDPVAAKVLKIEDGKNANDPTSKKISLSIKALGQDPWTVAQDQIREGQKVTGKVARIQTFGAFVEILPGVDGLIHISNMALGKRVSNPREIVQEGQEVEATVVSVDWQKRRIGLSLVKTPQELANELKRGSVFEGTVDRIESFGLFVKLPSGARGLVPAAETGTQRGTDLKKEFQAGSTVKVTVLEVDAKSGKIRLSIRAAAEAEERAEIEGYLGKDSGKGKGLGTLGDLLKDKFPNLK